MLGCLLLAPRQPVPTQPSSPQPNQLQTQLDRIINNDRFSLSAATFYPDGAPTDAPGAAGLVFVNVDAAGAAGAAAGAAAYTVEGLWRAVGSRAAAAAGGAAVIDFEPVDVVAGAPHAVWGGLLSLAPWRARYEGAEAAAVIDALWRHAYPSWRPRTPAGGGGSAAGGGGGGVSSSGGSAADGAPAGSSGGGATAAGVERAASGRAGERCPLCGVRRPGWAVIKPCRHWGPCRECLPSEPGQTLLVAPARYPKCLEPTCVGPVQQLLRIANT